MNDTCKKIISRGMMNRAFSVFGTVMATCRSLPFVDKKWNKVWPIHIKLWCIGRTDLCLGFHTFFNCNIETKIVNFTCVCYSQDQWWFAELLTVGLRLRLLYD
jgi:hypothetical protein